MSPERFISTLLEKYRQAPSFPFEDWPDNDVSAYALVNLWDDIFRVAAGDRAQAFTATAELRRHKVAYVYDVTSQDGRKWFNVLQQDHGGDFAVLVGWASEDRPDRTELGFNCDLDPARLAAAFDMIRIWSADTFEPERIENGFDMNDAFVERYADRFTFPPPLPDEDD